MIENEIQFVKRATQHFGPWFARHLETKGFSSHQFLHQWATVAEIINQDGFGPRVLDLGCGPGWSSIFLAGQGLEVTAADVSPDMLAIARRNAERLGLDIDFRLTEMQQGVPCDQPYDAVLIFDALHHCAEERAVLGHCYDALQPGGKILLVEPDWFHQFSPHAAHDRKHFGTTERSMGWGRLRRSLRACGFVRLRRFYNSYVTCGRGPIARLKALGTVALTLTVGYPSRPVVVLAERPGEQIKSQK